MSKLLTLEAWAREVYGERAPHIKTLRRWIAEGKIQPAPEKHGRQYFVQRDARYTTWQQPATPAKRRSTLLEKLNGRAAA